MKAVARLMLAYFTGTPLACGFTILALAEGAIGLVMMIGFPEFLMISGYQSDPVLLALGALSWLLPVAGICSLLLGGALMPQLFFQFARGHHLCVLPHGHLKLLASAFGTVLVVALAAATVIAAAYFVYPVEPGGIFAKALVATFFSYTLTYVALWFVSRSRTSVGVLGSMLLVILSLIVPFRFIRLEETTAAGWPLAISAVLWSVFAAGFMLAPRLRIALAAGLGRFEQFRRRRPAAARLADGTEVDLILGTANPWLLALAQVFPIVMASFFILVPGLWLFFLMLFSAVSCAVTSLAAARSRSLWLRTDWSRSELFARVEASFWRHNSYALGVLLVLLVVIGTVLDLPIALLAFGLPLLILGAITCTYLGLMVTKGIGWIETVLCVGTMVLLIETAIRAADSAAQTSTILAMELLLAGLAVLFRIIARRRWARLDWMLCRPESRTVARAAG